MYSLDFTNLPVSNNLNLLEVFFCVNLLTYLKYTGSFHSVLKKEEVYTTTYYTFEEAKSALFEYIESFYNRKRRHSALDYKTPQQVEDEALAA